MGIIKKKLPSGRLMGSIWRKEYKIKSHDIHSMSCYMSDLVSLWQSKLYLLPFISLFSSLALSPNAMAALIEVCHSQIFIFGVCNHHGILSLSISLYLSIIDSWYLFPQQFINSLNLFNYLLLVICAWF